MEILRLAIASQIVKLVPQRLKYRLANLLYPFDSTINRGIDIIIDYFPEHYGLKFLLNTHDYIGWNIFFLGIYEQETNEVLQEYLKPGMIVIEAGANHGSETVIIAQLIGKEGQVYAFEPIPELAERLSLNVKINKFEKIVTIEPMAIGDADKNIIFHIPDKSASNQGVGSKYQFNGASKTLEVQQVILDSWVEEKKIKRIDFIKMDIQGAEIDLLKGSLACIAQFRPILYLEADEVQTQNGSASLDQLYSILYKNNYNVYLVKTKQKTPLTSTNLIPGNWLALPA